MDSSADALLLFQYHHKHNHCNNYVDVFLEQSAAAACRQNTQEMRVSVRVETIY